MEDIPHDFTQLFNDSLFKFDTNLIPEAVKLYEALGVKHEPLTLIAPQFECPLPRMSPAVWPPALHEPPPPALDQFDLDEHFASEKIRLAQLTNKCTGVEDLEYFIQESGEILGVVGQLPSSQRSATHLLDFIFRNIVNFKKMNPEHVSVAVAVSMSEDRRALGTAFMDTEDDEEPNKSAISQRMSASVGAGYKDGTVTKEQTHPIGLISKGVADERSPRNTPQVDQQVRKRADKDSMSAKFEGKNSDAGSEEKGYGDDASAMSKT
jgi:hypothetical protein